MTTLPTTMTGLWFEQGTATLRHDLPLPQPTTGQALIQMLQVGICATDQDLLQGYKTFTGTPGHEFVGQVVACADHTWLGKRVVGAINTHCGHCAACRRGAYTHCVKRTVLGILNHPGAMAEYICLPVENLYEVHPDITDNAAVFAEPLAAAGRIVQQAPVRADESVLVIGDGKLGLLIAQVMALHGGAVQLVGHHPQRWAQLPQSNITALLAEKLERLPCMERVIVCGGGQAGLQLGQAMVQAEGLLVIKSTLDGTVGLDMNDLVIRELRVMGSRCGAFPPALNWLQRGDIATDFLIEARFPLSQAEQAMQYAIQQGRLKILLYNDMQTG
ncbi:MDR/zinc-dependent alcohol dehydrogenase-like family protein [Magnetococcus sp. PR-3]|uniref:MDR/zinc-dependent alcohol dehydrogenase-like family protein n=1 Tax=Magnetococcus sp. PR-3 TaxID=3120355 RepID=UPI002FCDF237